VIVLGTPFPDAFVVTKDGVFGAGLNVTFFDNTEKAEVDGLEGDDQIFVLSTRAGVVTTVIGGLGNDVISVLGDVTADIISNDLLGSSGLINHGVASTGGSVYSSVSAAGVAVSVMRPSAGALVHLQETGSNTAVSEDGVTDSYSVTLTEAPTTLVYVTVSAGVASDQDRSRQSESILVSKDGTTFRKALVLVFSPLNWSTAQQVTVKAIDDVASEGVRKRPSVTA